MPQLPTQNPSVLSWFGQWRVKPEVKLPARVERALADLRRDSEVLIGWVQATLVLVVGALYLVAPSTSPADAAFRPVPWALGIYALFTVARLVLAYRNQLTFWIKIASVVIDLSMLMITIWSFHIEHAQPAAFYLKAPTLLYVFIFIVLRALTITPGYGVFAGLVVSILIVTLVLSASVARARQLLFNAVENQAAVSQLARFFSPEIAQRLSRTDELLRPRDGELLDAAAMFIDLRGFTKLAAVLPPSELTDLLRDYQRVAVPIIHANKGRAVSLVVLDDSRRGAHGGLQRFTAVMLPST